MHDHKNGVNSLTVHSKDKEIAALFEYLKTTPATATQAAVALKIYRPNLSRYKRMLEINGQLTELKKVKCPVTQYTAMLLTTNPALILPSPQLNLFK